MGTRTRLLALGALAVVTLVAVAVGRRTGETQVLRAAGAPPASVVTEHDLPVLGDAPAPSLAGAAGWLNTAPLSVGMLSGKVVLYEFWTFGCINCQHTLSHVKAWYARYAADGLVVVAVHSPEFSYEADPANVQQYVTDQHITYPVALDPKMAVWRAWGTRAWPTFALFDRSGRPRLRHVGEGGYEQTEDAIRALLGVAPDSPRATV